MTKSLLLGSASALALNWFVESVRRRARGLTPSIASGTACTGAMVRQLRRGRRELIVPASAFSSPPIASVLLAAVRHGVAVHLLLDHAIESVPYPKGNVDAGPDRGLGRGSSPAWANLTTLIDSHYALDQPRVVLLIDRHTLLAGNFQFAPALLTGQDANSLLVVEGAPAFVDAYARQFLEASDLSHQVEIGSLAQAAKRPAA